MHNSPMFLLQKLAMDWTDLKLVKKEEMDNLVKHRPTSKSLLTNFSKVLPRKLITTLKEAREVMVEQEKLEPFPQFMFLLTA